MVPNFMEELVQTITCHPVSDLEADFPAVLVAGDVLGVWSGCVMVGLFVPQNCLPTSDLML